MDFFRLLVCFTICLPARSIAGEFRIAEERPPIRSPKLNEASGLAVSPGNDAFLWALNDSGGTADLHLFNTDGEDRGFVRIADVRNIDWEDLASFTLDGVPHLLIADTGDNNGVRKSVNLHILREPAIPADGAQLAGSAAVVWSVPFTYEGGPRDCEAVAVDAGAGKILLLSKRTKPPEVYELPLRAPKTAGTVIAKKAGTLLTDSPAGNLIPFANQPTGMDISSDGSFAAIATYYGVFVFPKQRGESWSEAFARKPPPLAPHGLAQAETIAISKDGRTIHVTSEGRNPPLVSYRKMAEAPAR